MPSGLPNAEKAAIRQRYAAGEISKGELLEAESGSIELSPEVGIWLTETAAALARVRPLLGGRPLSGDQRYAALRELGEAASRFRQAIYRTEAFTGQAQEPLGLVKSMLDDALAVIDDSIGANRRDDRVGS